MDEKMTLYREEDFYQEEGWPTEYLYYCNYIFPVEGGNPEYGIDFDQFAYVKNALYPYIRLTWKRNNHHFPCGGISVIASDGRFASLTDEERDKECPKLAWGFAAEFLVNLTYDNGQKDYVLIKDKSVLLNDYYQRYLNSYLRSHNGLKYSTLTQEQKELDFIRQHLSVIKGYWKKSTPLKQYEILYDYASKAESDYEQFVEQRIKAIQNTLMTRNNQFCTEIREPFKNKPCIKVFFLDDTVAPEAKEIVESLKCVMNVNITKSQSKAHSGDTLTVYPKPMVDAKTCENDIIEALSHYFAKEVVGNMKANNEAKFKNIEKHIMEYLNMAGASIDVCVAWFTIPELRDKLLEKAKDGVKVRVIIYKDGVNHAKGVDLTGLNHKEYRSERGGIMHDKFCVIDNVHTICGSYNWTRNAEEKNDEDAAFHFEDYKFASEYTKRFNQMWERDGVED